mmetsp:Transcript_34365/g.85665  ORF Transcript_34365/g.85665 Transcript_34365/m.85665 type:complete len:240 (+) Transcript_34365:1342-2061(+)
MPGGKCCCRRCVRMLRGWRLWVPWTTRCSSAATNCARAAEKQSEPARAQAQAHRPRQRTVPRTGRAHACTAGTLSRTRRRGGRRVGQTHPTPSTETLSTGRKSATGALPTAQSGAAPRGGTATRTATRRRGASRGGIRRRTSGRQTGGRRTQSRPAGWVTTEAARTPRVRRSCTFAWTRPVRRLRLRISRQRRRPWRGVRRAGAQREATWMQSTSWRASSRCCSLSAQGRAAPQAREWR